MDDLLQMSLHKQNVAIDSINIVSNRFVFFHTSSMFRCIIIIKWRVNGNHVVSSESYKLITAQCNTNGWMNGQANYKKYHGLVFFDFARASLKHRSKQQHRKKNKPFVDCRLNSMHKTAKRSMKIIRAVDFWLRCVCMNC